MGIYRGFFFIFSCCIFISSAYQTEAATTREEHSRIDSLLSMSLEELVNLKVTVTTGTPKTLKLAPAIASIITAEDIERIGATTLDEALETIPGLHVGRSEFYFGQIWSIRGLHTDGNTEALLLINGVPFKNIQNGTRPFKYLMPVSMISRIEIIRGPGSAVYGADAFSGVINVITKNTNDINGTEAGFRGGSFDTYNGWLLHGGTYAGWDFALNIEARRTEGDEDQIIEQDRLGTGYPSLTPAPMDTRHELLDGHLNLHKGNWNVNMYGSVYESALGLGGAQVVTYGNEVETKLFLGDLTYRNDSLVEDWDISAQLYTSYQDNDIVFEYYPAHFLNMIGNPIVETEEVGLEMAGIYQGWTGHIVRLAAGLRYSEQNIDQYKNFTSIPTPPFIKIGQLRRITDPDEIYQPDADRTLWYLSLQDEWTIARDWELTAGVRYDEYNDFGSTVNPRLALVWQITDQLTSKLLYGRAFLAPSFGQMYNKNNPVAIGNPNLGPEEIDTMELAFDYQPLATLRTNLNLFAYKADDIIEYAGAPPQLAQNIGEQEGRGFEIELDWRPEKHIRVYSNFAYQYSENTKINATIHDAPEMQFYLNPHWEFMPNWSLDGQAYWIGKRHRESGDPREDIDDYWLVNMTLRKKNILKKWDFALAVRNLFDEGAREPSPYDPLAPQGAWAANDYPLKGFEVWAELRFHF